MWLLERERAALSSRSLRQTVRSTLPAPRVQAEEARGDEANPGVPGAMFDC